MSNLKKNVSVCIPTYNGEEYFAQCLNSVITQTYHDLEILIVDDQSSDSTLDISAEFAKYDDRIKILKNPKNLGLVGNWNESIKKAKHDWVKLVFQDDILHPHCIERLLHVSDVDKTNIALCSRKFIFENDADPSIKKYFTKTLIKLSDIHDDTTKIETSQIENYISEHILVNIFGEPTTYLFNKKICKKYGYFNDKISQLCDYEYIAKVALREPISFVSDELAIFRIHQKATSTSNRGKERSLETKVKVDYIDNIVILKTLLKDVKLSENKKLLSDKIEEIEKLIEKNNETKIYKKEYKKIYN